MLLVDQPHVCGQHRLGDDVLLSIVSVQPISPHLRQTAPHPIAPHPLAGAPPPWGPLVEGPCPRVVPAVDVLCQLEGSGTQGWWSVEPMDMGTV